MRKFETTDTIGFRPLYVVQPHHTSWLVSAVVKSSKHSGSKFVDEALELSLSSQAVKNIELGRQASYPEKCVSKCHSCRLILMLYWYTVIRN